MAMIKLVFLGSGSSVPTAERNHPGIHLDYEGDSFLWDCGEGAQRQMMRAGLKLMRINRIFITHWHADHFAGLIGLIETYNLGQRKRPLTIYGPEATRFVDAFSELSYWDFGFELEAKDIEFEGSDMSKIFENEFYKILSVPVKHSVPAVAYCLEEKDRWNIDIGKIGMFGLREGPILEKLKEEGKIKFGGKVILLKNVASKTSGKKIVYSGDTAPCRNVERLAKEADLLVHDGTFLEGLEERGDERHTSVRKAAEIAKKAHAKRLILTHFSRRYKNVSVLIKEARKVFPKTDPARDLMKILV